MRAIERRTEGISELDRAIEELQTERRNLKNEIVKTKREIVSQQETYNQDVERFQEQQRINKEKMVELQEQQKILEGIKKEKHEKKGKAYNAKIQHSVDRTNLAMKIKQAQGFKRAREDALRRCRIADFDAICNAKRWIEQNQDQFDHEIILPGIFEIEARDAAAVLLLDHVGIQDLSTFVCQSRSDSTKLLQVVKRFGRVAVAFMEGDDFDLDLWREEALEYEKFGFSGLLLDEIRGPKKLLAFLCKEKSIHLMAWAESRIDDLNYRLAEAQEERMSKYYVLGQDNVIIQRKRMRYGSNPNELSQVTSPLETKHPTEYEPYSIAENKDKISKLDNEMALLDKKKTELMMAEKAAQNELNEASTKLKKLENEIELLNLKINERVGSKNEEKRLKRNLMKFLDRIQYYPKIILKIKMEQKKLLKEIWKYTTQYEKCRKELVSKIDVPDDDIKHMATLEVELMVAQTALSEEKARLVNVRRQGESIKQELQQLIRTCTDLNGELTAFCQNFNFKAESVKKRIKKEHPPHWNEKMVVNSIEEMRRKSAEIREEIETEISRLRIRRDQTMVDEDVDEDSVRNHKKLEQDIKKKENEIVQLKTRKESEVEQAEELKNRWLPELRAQVQKVSERMTRNFARIKCKGRLELAEEGENYKEYGLNIVVRFQNNTAERELTMDNSGGERSVATMLSILSMPTSNCPFRLVDEINQGMDKYNEHSVMKAVKEIIDDSPEDEVCQFFIITPKLLMGLDYPRRSQVTILHNVVPFFPRKASNFRKELQRQIANDREDADEATA